MKLERNSFISGFLLHITNSMHKDNLNHIEKNNKCHEIEYVSLCYYVKISVLNWPGVRQNIAAILQQSRIEQQGNVVITSG